MTAIELFYSSLPADLVDKPYYAGDYEEFMDSDLATDAFHEYRLMMDAGIRPSSFEEDFSDT